MIKSFKILALVMLSMFICKAQAQNYLDFNEMRRFKSSFVFDNSWEYLTTEIYPFNFQFLPNIYEQKIRKNLQCLYIYAKIRGGEYDKIEYPLYFYQKKDKILRIRHADKITLFRGLSIKNEDEIDAEITIDGINEKNQFVKIISDQVDLLGDIKNPLLIPKLMERFKEYKDKFNMGYEYSFTKTILLFEKTDGRRVHSVSFYYINSYENLSDYPSLPPNTIQKDVDNNVDIDNDYLKGAIPSANVPYIVIVNYLSRGETKSEDSTVEENESAVSEEDNVPAVPEEERKPSEDDGDRSSASPIKKNMIIPGKSKVIFE